MDSPLTGGLGLAHFLLHTDLVARGVLLVLVLLSLCSWYVILTKAFSNVLSTRKAERFLAQVRVHGMPDAIDPAESACTRLAHAGIQAAGQASPANLDLALAGGLAEYLTRTLNQEIDREAADSEQGLTLLASVGSSAPYLGLFGTVWGIYHALLQIGLSGQGTLDKVAGPVGEALIMTALGLFVAIPAGLAYNAFTRRNRIWLARLEGFAHELYVLLTVSHPPPEYSLQESDTDGAGHGR